jgi:hypothetical protein
MTGENILEFAKLFLKDNPQMDEFELRNFIFGRPEVAIKLPISDIRKALDDGWKSGLLEIVQADKEQTIYRLTGYVPVPFSF